MRSRFGCTAYLIIGALVLAVGALAYALAGTMTIALFNSAGMLLTNVLLVGVVALGAGGVSLSLMLRNPAIKQLVISALARRFKLPIPDDKRPMMDDGQKPIVIGSRPMPNLLPQRTMTVRSQRKFIDPRIVEEWFRDEE